jgi:hypothetical protein
MALVNIKCNSLIPQNYWVSELCPSSGILSAGSTTFRKLDLVRSSGEERETPTLLDPVLEVFLRVPTE